MWVGGIRIRSPLILSIGRNQTEFAVTRYAIMRNVFTFGLCVHLTLLSNEARMKYTVSANSTIIAAQINGIMQNDEKT